MKPYSKAKEYSKNEINKAGDEIRLHGISDKPLDIINTWRALHAHVINAFQAILRNRTKGKRIYVGQRLKRIETIISKLHRQPKMNLARMDDIAGCRLIFMSVKALRKFREEFHKSRFKHELMNESDKYDYIKKPKVADGYRGVHDIYKFNTASKKGEMCNGLHLELQYRTMHQHAWATAVEIIGMISNDQPKFHHGNRNVIEFFKVASEIIARSLEDEANNLYPHLDDKSLIKIFYKLDTELNIMEMLKKSKKINSSAHNDKFSILSFNYDMLHNIFKDLEIFSYQKEDDAVKKYFNLEKDARKNVVLVLGDNFKDIKISYGNYFSDSKGFIKYMENGISILHNR